jgi:hypothetical protein
MKVNSSMKLPSMKKADRSLRLSSKPEEQMTGDKCKTILENNKYFPHLYDPYYDRKDVKERLNRVLNEEAQMKQRKMVNS